MDLDNSIGSFDLGGTPPSKAADNKTEFRTTMGDSDPLIHNLNDQPADYAHDVSGVPGDAGRSTQMDMDMGLEPNKFPRQTGHDSLTEEQAQLS